MVNTPKSFKVQTSFNRKQNGLKTDKYNVVVVGGGSAGIACAMEAKKLGLSVALVNYVKPTDFGTKWGLGGTCLNVGCIPKYFYHQAAEQRRKRDLRRVMGIDTPLSHINWEKMSNAIQNYISSESHKLNTLLREQKIKHFNRLGYMINPKEVALLKNWESLDSSIENNFQDDNKLLADYFLICTGERPVTKISSFKGLEKAITSDEVFKVKTRPKTALVLGGGFSAMEIASLLQGLGVQTTLYHRSKFVRSLDSKLVG